MLAGLVEAGFLADMFVNRVVEVVVRAKLEGKEMGRRGKARAVGAR